MFFEISWLESSFSCSGCQKLVVFDRFCEYLLVVTPGFAVQLKLTAKPPPEGVREFVY